MLGLLSHRNLPHLNLDHRFHFIWRQLLSTANKMVDQQRMFKTWGFEHSWFTVHPVHADHTKFTANEWSFKRTDKKQARNKMDRALHDWNCRFLCVGVLTSSNASSSWVPRGVFSLSDEVHTAAKVLCGTSRQIQASATCSSLLRTNTRNRR